MDIKEQNRIFPVILEEENQGGYVVINPAIDGCYSQGDTIEEALQNIKEATELCLEDMAGLAKNIRVKNVSLHLINLDHSHA